MLRTPCPAPPDAAGANSAISARRVPAGRPAVEVLPGQKVYPRSSGVRPQGTGSTPHDPDEMGDLIRTVRPLGGVTGSRRGRIQLHGEILGVAPSRPGRRKEFRGSGGPAVGFEQPAQPLAAEDFSLYTWCYLRGREGAMVKARSGCSEDRAQQECLLLLPSPTKGRSDSEN
jgi:hypothetical protein